MRMMQNNFAIDKKTFDAKTSKKFAQKKTLRGHPKNFDEIKMTATCIRDRDKKTCFDRVTRPGSETKGASGFKLLKEGRII